MDFLTSTTTQYQTPKHKQKQRKQRLTHDQVRLLEESFASNSKLESELKLELASQIGIPPRQVAIWYQNKRAKWKAQSLEVDYYTLQVKLEYALAEKMKLENMVTELQGEIRNARDTAMFAFSNQDQGVTHHHHHHEDHVIYDANQILPLEDLYACLFGDDD